MKSTGIGDVPTPSAMIETNVPTMVYNSSSTYSTLDGKNISHLPEHYDGFTNVTSVSNYSEMSESVSHSKEQSTENYSSQIDFPEVSVTSSLDDSNSYPIRSEVRPSERTLRNYTKSTPLHEVTTEGRIFFNLCFTKKPFINSFIKSESVKNPTPKEIFVSKSPAYTKVFWNLCPTKKPNIANGPPSTPVVTTSTPKVSSSSVEADEEFSTTETTDSSYTELYEETTQ